MDVLLSPSQRGIYDVHGHPVGALFRVKIKQHSVFAIVLEDEELMLLGKHPSSTTDWWYWNWDIAERIA